jgi:ABC-type nitrate/sulfonate/bicarbonate transport system permease component
VTASTRIPDLTLPCLGTVSVLGLCELIARADVVAGRGLPPVSDVLSTLWGELGTGVQWLAAGQTVEGWALGLGVAAVLAIPRRGTARPSCGSWSTTERGRIE